ncbi:MAG: hypothetical protein ABSH26_16395 [Opitutaceae bacterium]|jgi:hypothetical protein
MGSTTLSADNGSFEVEVRPESGSGRDEIVIKYTADKKKVACEKILMIQKLVEKVDGTVTKKFSKKPNGGDKFRGFDAEVTGDGSVIDHLPCQRYPYMNGGYDNQSTGQAGSTTEGKFSRMSDAPNQPASNFPKDDSTINIEFESCAYCLDTKTFLDCVRWTFEQQKGKNGKISPPTAASAPSAGMTEALGLFDKAHTDGNGFPMCPDKQD